MDSVELLEELAQLQDEFGAGKCQLPDTVESRWWHDIDHIDFNPETQTYRFVPD